MILNPLAGGSTSGSLGGANGGGKEIVGNTGNNSKPPTFSSLSLSSFPLLSPPTPHPPPTPPYLTHPPSPTHTGTGLLQDNDISDLSLPTKPPLSTSSTGGGGNGKQDPSAIAKAKRGTGTTIMEYSGLKAYQMVSGELTARSDISRTLLFVHFFSSITFRLFLFVRINFFHISLVYLCTPLTHVITTPRHVTSHNLLNYHLVTSHHHLTSTTPHHHHPIITDNCCPSCHGLHTG